jgi:hypothetical protein
MYRDSASYKRPGADEGIRTLGVTGRAKPATGGEVKTGHLRSDVIL